MNNSMQIKKNIYGKIYQIISVCLQSLLYFVLRVLDRAGYCLLTELCAINL